MSEPRRFRERITHFQLIEYCHGDAATDAYNTRVFNLMRDSGFWNIPNTVMTVTDNPWTDSKFLEVTVSSSGWTGR